ncbi:MAG: hypothetical protein NZM94_03340, partial [Roseiflexus sp.]|nr:hypothetical protein [Roseiflexus sp.]
ADIAILRATLLRAQEKALIGFANLTVQEREELAAVMQSLVSGIDRTLKEIGQTVKTVSGVALPFDSILEDNQDIRDVLEYISDTLVNTTMSAEAETRPERAAIQAARAEREPRSRSPQHDPREAGYYQSRLRTRRLRRDDEEDE